MPIYNSGWNILFLYLALQIFFGLLLQKELVVQITSDVAGNNPNVPRTVDYPSLDVLDIQDHWDVDSGA